MDRNLEFVRQVVVRNNNTITVTIPIWLVNRLNLNKNSLVRVNIEKVE